MRVRSRIKLFWSGETRGLLRTVSLTAGLGTFVVATTILCAPCALLIGGLGFDIAGYVLAFIGGPALVAGMVTAWVTTRYRRNVEDAGNACFECRDGIFCHNGLEWRGEPNN